MTVPGPRLVLLGMPGSGKGTQSALLSGHYDVSHLSTGELFRAAVAQGTPIGREVKVFLDNGDLVPDDIVIRVVEEYFAEGGPLEDGFILDGFPRTLVQAEALDRVLVGSPLDLVLDLEVPSAVILDRIAGRRVCAKCGNTYHVTQPPEHGWTCDTCGGDVVLREDDTEEAVRRRLELYEEVTVPIIEFYRKLGLLVVIDGDGSATDVHERLLKEIDGRVDDSSR
jgi:adenylate kinase